MNRGGVFVDAGYWIALVHQRDQLHERARKLSVGLGGPLITTEPVLLEVGNTLSAALMRGLVVALISRLRANPAVEIAPLTPHLFARALELYAPRPDKEWGLTDCVSFVVMQERGIVEALAADQHFIRAGFRALLREDAP